MKRENFRRLEPDELRAVYKSEMRRDFPAAELKSIAHIERMIEAGIYTAFGLFEASLLVAYALIAEDADVVLLDYLAVSAERGKGYGSRMLALLARHFASYRAILGEIDAPEAAKGDERAKRETRYRFYLKNGWQITGVTVSQFGETLRVFCLPSAAPPADAEIRACFARLYEDIYGVDFREGRVIIHPVENSE